MASENLTYFLARPEREAQRNFSGGMAAAKGER